MICEHKKQDTLYINLQGKTLGNYLITYHVNDCYKISELSKFSFKHQLLFQKFESKIQQMNLMLIDSVFPIILADLTLEVFINDIKSFNQYIASENKIKIMNISDEMNYFEYKFYHFIYYLLYSKIALNKVCKGESLLNMVYSLKNKMGELERYSIYERNILQLILLNRIKLEIDLASSSINKHQVKLCLNLLVN